MNEDRMDDDALWLDAGLDGELDAARSLALERRLESDPAFRARWEARCALRDAVRAHASYHPAPAALRARIEAALASAAAPAGEAGARPVMAAAGRTAPGFAASAGSPDGTGSAASMSPGAPRPASPSAAPAARWPRAWRWPWLVASGAGGAFVAAGLTVLVLAPQALHGRHDGAQVIALAPGGAQEGEAGLAAEAVSAHTRAMLVGETIEIASSDRHTVRPWLAARLNFVPAIADFASQGYALAGARRDVIGGETAAALVYRHGAHVISVFVRPLRDAPLAEGPPVLRVVRGFNVVEMTHAGMAYSLVSDMNEKEMTELAQLLRE
jgi:anti-sigma factor RsiW